MESKLRLDPWPGQCNVASEHTQVPDRRLRSVKASRRAAASRLPCFVGSLCLQDYTHDHLSGRAAQATRKPSLPEGFVVNLERRTPLLRVTWDLEDLDGAIVLPLE